MDNEREPCPYRIIDDIGTAFAMGLGGGSIFHAVKGARHSPKGERLYGSLQAVKTNARRLGGSFAVWGGLFSTYDCALSSLRKKDDMANSIAAGFMTGYTLALRNGQKTALMHGAMGGVFLAIIEGVMVAAQRLMSPRQVQEMEAQAQAQAQMAQQADASTADGAMEAQAQPANMEPTFVEKMIAGDAPKQAPKEARKFVTTWEQSEA